MKSKLIATGIYSFIIFGSIAFYVTERNTAQNSPPEIAQAPLEIPKGKALVGTVPTAQSAITASTIAAEDLTERGL